MATDSSMTSIQAGDAVRGSRAATRKEVSDIYPLTYMQGGLLFHSLQAGAAEEYVVQISCKLTDIDPDRWRKAWEQVSEHADILRTAFAWKNVSRPMQAIRNSVKLDWISVDRFGMTEAERSNALKEYLAQDRARSFDLSKAPLHRLTLFSYGDGQFEFLWTYHHLILDAWSAAIIMDWVVMAYSGAKLPTATPFKHYIRWVQKRGIADSHNYWSEKLASYTEPSSPPLLHRTSIDGLRDSVRETRLLSSAQTEHLAQVAQKGRITVATLVQAAWALTLRDFSDKEDVVFGWVVADRPPEIAGISSMAGLMINMVPVIVNCTDDIGVRALLRTLQEESTTSWEHGRLSLTDIHELAQLEPGEALFESVVVFENLPSLVDAGEFGIQVHDRQAHWRTTYPISLMVAPGERLKSEIVFNAEQLESAAIAAMLERFQAHLLGIGEMLDGRVAELPRASEQPAELMCRNTAAAVSTDFGAEMLKRLQARGEAVAIESVDGDLLGGRQLVEASQRLAQQLLQMNLSSGDVVATHLDKDVGQLVALLALISIGCPVLPIDPCLPSDRKKYMLADSGAQLVIARLEDGSSELELPLARLSPAGELSGDVLEKRPAAKLPAGSAYILYTSGSTGNPKGVVVPLSALENLLSSFATHPGLTSTDRFLALTTVSFDISLLELLGPLWAGATLLLSPQDALRDAQKLVSLIESKEPTVMQATPVTWRMLIETGWNGSPNLRAWCGGEALERNLAEQLLPLVGQLSNVYGPTEATIWALVEEVKSAAGEPITLGRPVNGMQAIVLDSYGNPTPVGGRGELCLSGIGLATGYHNQDASVEAVFCKNPLGDNEFARLYRTGDVVHLMSDGRLRYLGRKDDQIKLRGMRLELLEVDAALQSQAAVSAAASRLWERPDGERELVGYIVCSEPVDMTVFRTALAERLPPGAVPTKILQIESLPITPSGKKDRNALPEPDWESVSMGSTVHRSHIAQVVAGIWEHALGVASVGPADGFFALGGHSIKVLTATMQINKQLGTTLSFAHLFRAPRLADYVALVEENLAEGTGNKMVVPERRDRSQWHTPSAAQQRLWFANRLDEDGRAYQLSSSLHFSGALDVQALADSIIQLQHMHEALRTVFREHKGEPELFILPEPVNELEVYDASSKTCNELAQEPLELEDKPAARFVLLRESSEQAELVFVIHHVLVDEWSLAILCGDLGSLYLGHVKGKKAERPAAQLDFIDFLAPTSNENESAASTSSHQYWLQELTDVQSTTLPYDYQAGNTVDFDGGHHRIELPSSLCAHIGRVSRSNSVTLFTTILTGIFATLSRYVSSDDICIGVMDAGRTLAEMDRVVGPFSRALPVRLRLKENETVATLMAGLQKGLIESSMRGEVPDISKELNMLPWRRGNPFYNILVVMQNMPERPKAFGEVQVEVTAVDTGIAETDILIEIFTVDDRLAMRFVYRRNRFRAERIADFADRLHHIMLQVLDDPSTPVCELELLSEKDRRKMLVDWNATDVAYPAELSIQDLFEQQVLRTPDSTALVTAESSLTYSELNQQANQLANRLKDSGVGPDVRVGVFAERSQTLILGLLGIIKAGGVYLPIDASNNPEARIKQILTDAAPAMLLTDDAHMQYLPEHAMEVLCLDLASNELSQRPVENPASVVSPENLAYVIYTSGSSGVPKGVANTVAGLGNRLQWFKSGVIADVPMTTAFKTNIGFVDSVTEILGCLVSGGKLVTFDREDVLNARGLLAGIEEHDIQYLLAVPSLLRELLAVEGGQDTPLEIVVSSGENLPRDLIESFRKRWPNTRLFNFYGASELNGDAIYTECHEGILAMNEDVIGRPISNTQAYILDDELKPVPVGIPGELHIAGSGLARGYLNQENLMAERFIRNPFNEGINTRLYKTGDLARYLPDGNIVYLGRVDSQIKLRGFTVEPAEIVNALTAQADVAQAVVIMREDEPGDKRLVAYIVARYGRTPNMSLIRKSIKQTLPDYMVPAAIVVLDSIPLNANGKLHISALPKPSLAAITKTEYTAPRTDTEKLVAELWSDVLDIERVGIHDNFFDLGGHSLQVQKVAFQLSEILGVEIPLKLFFEDLELAAFSEQLEESYAEAMVADK